MTTKGQRFPDQYLVQIQSLYDPDNWEDEETFDDEQRAIWHGQSLLYPGGPNTRVIRIRRKVIW